MSRTLRQLPEILQKLDQQQILRDQQAHWMSYDITVITPMFGGSAVSNQIYKEKPIRESSVRGQLRFWWRATRGAAFNSVYELRKREREIFGDTMKPSSLKIVIESLSKAYDKTYNPKNESSFIPAYLFQKPQRYVMNCRFRLKLSWSDNIQKLCRENPSEFEQLNHDLNAALWGWINFGGVGSRTRRGAGSLFCKSFSPNRLEASLQGFYDWLQVCQNRYEFKLSAYDEKHEWPTLSSRMRVNFDETNQIKNWKKLLTSYKDFRRRANVDGETNETTRSHWPEADSIRELLNAAHPKHERSLHRYSSVPKDEVRGFPRAILGMPIIFRFRQVNESPYDYLKEGQKARRSSMKEPDTSQLTPANKERLASPVILKPLAFEHANSIAIIAVLNQPKIGKLELKVQRSRIKKIIPITSRPLDYRLSPLQGETQLHSNAIDAFLDSKEVKDFWNPQKP